MNKHKLYFVIAITLPTLIVGLYFSGYLTLWLLKLDTGLLKWNTHVGYFRALDLPELAPYVTKIKWGGYLGFGVPAAAWLALTVLILKPKEKSLHGEARFAGRSDLAKHGMLKPSPTGIVICRDVARTLITNHALQIVFAPREQQDANDYSEMLGYTTVRKNNVTRGRDFSRSESEERRALMLPQELKAMGPDKQIFLYEGLAHPVMCDKIKYYKDRYFKEQILTKVKIPTLKI